MSIKIILMIVIVLVCVGTAYTQDIDSVNGINGKGVKIGFGVSMMNTGYTNLEPFFDAKVGFQGGAFLTYNLNQKFSIQPELLLSVKGVNHGGIYSILDWSIYYLEIPVLAKYDFAYEKKLKPFVYIGPSVSFLLSSEFDVIFTESFDVTDYMEKVDFGIVFGTGFNYKKITFDARYTLGLSKVIDAEGINNLTGAAPDDLYFVTENPDVTNGYLSFMIGYKF